MKPSSTTLYPNLLDDYSVINMPPSPEFEKLLPTAEQLATALRGNISSLETMFHKSQKGAKKILFPIIFYIKDTCFCLEFLTLSSDSALIKIGRPVKYVT